MKASTVTSTAQAPTPLPAPVQHLFLSEFTPMNELSISETRDPEQQTLRAVKMTFVLREILANHGYPHGGLNE